MELNSKFIYTFDLLKSLPFQLVDDYLKSGRFIKKYYCKDEILHIEGDECNQIELIISGEIAVDRIDPSGNLLTVAVFRQNAIIGSNLLFSSTNNYPMTVISKKETTVLIFKKELVFELCNQYPSFLLQFVKIISDHTITIGTKIKNHVSRTIRESIIAYLKQQYLLQDSYTIRLNISKKALAEQFGISRTSLSRELQKMKELQLIEFDMKTITVLDPEILADYA